MHISSQDDIIVRCRSGQEMQTAETLDDDSVQISSGKVRKIDATKSPAILGICALHIE